MKVSIIGQGYVGLTIAMAAAEYFEVTGYDSNQKIVDQLKFGVSHIEGVESSKLQRYLRIGTYKVTNNGSDIQDSDVIVIAVPTPLTQQRRPDLSYIESACKTIGQNLTKPVLVINESTSFPGTLRSFIRPTIEKTPRHQSSTCTPYLRNVWTQAEVISIRGTRRDFFLV